MTKLFFDVFPTLNIDNDSHMLFEKVEVTKITSTSARNHIKVYIYSTHLIPKKTVCYVENQIEEQLFSQGNIPVTIIEEYRLSEQYTPENLMHAYKESILFELEQKSVLEKNMFQKAKCRFEGERTMCLTMADTIVAEGKTSEITSYLKDVFENRFHVPVDVEIDYEEVKESKYKKFNEMQLQQEVDAIRERNQKLQAQHATEEAAKAKETEGISKKKAEKAEDAAKEADASSTQNKQEQKKTETPKKQEFAGKSSGFKSGKGSFVRRDYPLKRSDDPNVIYGRDFDDMPIELKTVTGEMGEITFRGQVISFDTREIRNEKTIVMFAVTDFTDTIMVKMFTRNDQLPDLLAEIKKGVFLKIKGVTTIDKFDGELTIGSVTGIRKTSDFRVTRKDKYPEKRVELHCHTKMSDMDGVSEAKDLVKRAHDWGHPAIAITDHGVVQGFTDANHVIEDLDKDDPFKVIYGVEGYLVDDLTKIAENEKGQDLEGTYVVFDIETTGFSAVTDRIIEIGAVKVEDGKITDKFSTFVNPKRPIPFRITELTGITDEMVIDSPDIETILPQFIEFIGDAVLVAHNASFDVGFIEQNCKRQKIEADFTYVDTVALARVLLPALNRFKLDTVAKALNISLENHHRAVDDAGCTAEIFVKFVQMLKERELTTLAKVNEFGDLNPDSIKKLPTYHVIILARNDIGRVNLYQLVSASHLVYYNRRPRIPKSVLNEHREGLIVGSACEAGELYRALLDGKPDETIAKIADFYDYLEIQPLGNNAFMVESDKVTSVNSMEDIMDLNRKIVHLGEQFHKPVVGTCDVHFMDPEDEVYRRIIMAGKGFGDADKQAPLYLRTTEEMLDEFAYLGSEKAYEVVIRNTNLIADMIEKISPVRPDKCPPVIENSDQMLRDICYNKAHSMYGDPLPEIVHERLERELNSIISNGFAVMYIIAQKLVWKSVADGYLVGSRGSVGSSFVAYMAGITEVNSLQAHYLCPKCHYVDFDSDYVKSFSGRSGCDMEDRVCPVCGEPLMKEGHDIPFETFLGFKGNKEPDIDLNFSGDYQSKAHAYTEVIFGKGKTFRAGTVGTLADKTAYGYAMHYYEEHEQHKRSCELDRISSGCVGVRRTTGQHPGGIIVVPHGEEIYSFTPVQHPANDQTTKIITTHFDYHSIDHNLLKLDILGHDDPTMIRMLEDITGVDATKIRLDDPEVLSLFHGLEALHIKPEDIGGTDLGSLGIPEFGTEFVMQMLRDTKPKAFSDLVRISGLSHGTDVWLGNAQTLIQEGKAQISTAICTRDDIMIYLIDKGVESEQSFKIMESVRKGKGLTPDYEKVMKEHDVPDWYLWSCKKIKYMFPKAHAVAYVMMGIRIAWFKIHEPLAYYAAFFTIRATAFDYGLMCQGKAAIDNHIKAYKANPNLSKKEQDTLRDMKIVQEFYARGFEFLKIDLYQSDAIKFQVVEGKLLPPFSVIEGMGGIAAEALAVAAHAETERGEKFLSKDDIRQKAKVSQTVLDTMAELGLLGGLPESNQLSIFDFGF